jgi:hypothetical protein
LEGFYYDIVYADDAYHRVSDLVQLITGQPLLREHGKPWSGPRIPRQADLYVMLVIVSDGLTNNVALRRRITDIGSCGFPVVPVVEDLATYDFRASAIEEVVERNAEAFSAPERLIQTLLHHAGLRLFGSGGNVFVSYARSDGAEFAEAIRAALIVGGVAATVDLHEFPGGELVQDEIERRVNGADLVILIDSKGAATSEWVAEELDIAQAAHVPVVAVMPTASAFRSMIEVPHVEWKPGLDAVADAVACARRILARKETFRKRVGRTLSRLARLRSWEVTEDTKTWRVQAGADWRVNVGFTADGPRAEEVMRFRDWTKPVPGVFVAGTRHHHPVTVRALDAVGDGVVRVSALPTLASRVPLQLVATRLNGKRIFLSASKPNAPDDVLLAQYTFGPFLVSLVQVIVELKLTLVFGGHPSVLPLVHRAAVGHFGTQVSDHFQLHLARFWERDFLALKEEIRLGPVPRNLKWHGSAGSAEDNVVALRDAMIGPDLDAAIFVGGKTTGYIGPVPGIVDEHQRWIAACQGKPTFVLGLAGGASRALPSDGSRLDNLIRTAADPDLAVALIVAELLRL